MDNSPEGQNSQQKPDLGEGIKPEDVVYSSQDITSKTLAGEGQDYFTRVKHERPGLRNRIKNLRIQKTKVKTIKNDRIKNKRMKIIIIVFSFLVAILLIAAIILVVFLLNQPKQAPSDAALQEAVSLAETTDVSTKDGREDFYAQVNEVAESDSENSYEAAENLYLEKIKMAEGSKDWELAYSLRLNYIEFLLAHGNLTYAESLLVEMDPDDFPSDHIRRKYYAVSADCYRRLNNESMYLYYSELNDELTYRLNLEEDHQGVEVSYD
ncbi:hypothetical protein IJH74_01515 [Candidatus Saccharibacteria bacterium]|nr:hypothetical protein [Candidatus Saccharibacteria bacterium]